MVEAMNRMDFIRLGGGTAVFVLLGAVPGIGAATPADGLDRWAARHGASITFREGSRHLFARKCCEDVGMALHELNVLSDGPLVCQGNQACGITSGQRFVVELALIS